MTMLVLYEVIEQNLILFWTFLTLVSLPTKFEGIGSYFTCNVEIVKQIRMNISNQDTFDRKGLSLITSRFCLFGFCKAFLYSWGQGHLITTLSASSFDSFLWSSFGPSDVKWDILIHKAMSLRTVRATYHITEPEQLIVFRILICINNLVVNNIHFIWNNLRGFRTSLRYFVRNIWQK